MIALGNDTSKIIASLQALRNAAEIARDGAKASSYTLAINALLAVAAKKPAAQVAPVAVAPVAVAPGDGGRLSRSDTVKMIESGRAQLLLNESARASRPAPALGARESTFAFFNRPAPVAKAAPAPQVDGTSDFRRIFDTFTQEEIRRNYERETAKTAQGQPLKPHIPIQSVSLWPQNEFQTYPLAATFHSVRPQNNHSDACSCKECAAFAQLDRDNTPAA